MLPRVSRVPPIFRLSNYISLTFSFTPISDDHRINHLLHRRRAFGVSYCLRAVAEHFTISTVEGHLLLDVHSAFHRRDIREFFCRRCLRSMAIRSPARGERKSHLRAKESNRDDSWNDHRGTDPHRAKFPLVLLSSCRGSGDEISRLVARQVLRRGGNAASIG